MKDIFLKIRNYKIWKFIIIFLMVLIFLFLSAFFYNAYYAHKVYPGVYLQGKSMGNWTYSEVYNFLEEKTSILNEQGWKYKFQDEEISIYSKTKALDDPDLNRELIRFYNLETAKSIFEAGRTGNFFTEILNQLILIFNNRNFTWQYDFDQEEWKNILKSNFSKYEISYTPPQIIFSEGEIEISEAIAGQEFDYEEIIRITEDKINNFDFSLIELELKNKESEINKVEAENKKDLIFRLAELKEIILSYEGQDWKISKEDYLDWLILIKNEEQEIKISLDLEKYKAYLEEKIIPLINKEALNAKFEIKDGRVIEFQGSRDGLEVNLESTFKNIEEAINSIEEDFSGDFLKVEIVVEVQKAEINTHNVNDLGIQEIIGTGESDFRGSPPNRVHNIETGAEKLNGLLVAPGEEFSTMTNLLPVDATAGYLPELVIKGNETIPEYGGGLCQIGTTVYRAALQSGLKITQRRPHSYRVSYYEPAGMDATIYDPWPDMKFVNDTDRHILVQSRIVGTKLYFDFWGTKDGRQVTVTDPVIYNIVSPGPTKEIETLDLEPGKRKCTESAHAGADAYFDYKVEYVDDRETYEERVRSRYVPWQAVCLIGVEELSEDLEEEVDGENSEEVAEEENLDTEDKQE